jgi:hypothetical protein
LVAASGGDYYRLLIPGEYLVSASAKGYKSAEKSITINKSLHTPAQKLDFGLEPEALQERGYDLEDVSIGVRRGVSKGVEDGCRPPALPSGNP